MVKFIHGIFGTEMWVAEDRAEEYKVAGHKPAASKSEADKPTEQVKPKQSKKK